MTDKPIKVFIAVGSNIDPEINILQALKRIKEHVKITGISTFYRTPPIERPEQQPFLNGVWRIETLMSARTLKFNCLRTIENELGRVRTEDKYAARTIDLDIIIYGDMVIDEPDLQIPDPDIYTRSFIAVPLLELEPELILPDTQQPLASIVDQIKSEGLEPVTELSERLKNMIS